MARRRLAEYTPAQELFIYKPKLQTMRDRQPVDTSMRKHGHTGDRAGWSKPIRNPSTGHTPEYLNWREAVLLRDGYACVFCGSKERLEADHIKPKSIYPEQQFVVENGRTLCHSCHTQTETYGSRVHRLVSVHT